MKFLTKNINSDIHTEGLTYLKNADNSTLRNRLLSEQKNFCAYTEKYVQDLDSVEVEHLNASLKYEDDYFNYYAVLRSPNLYKKDEKFKEHDFFKSLFFQNASQFQSRIQYKNGIYYETNENDFEARDLIEFLGFNHPSLSKQRTNHLSRLKSIFKGFNDVEKQTYFKFHREELSFITALEVEFIDLNFSKILDLV